MRERGLTVPEIMLIGGTRVALGVGLGLLIEFSHDTRKGAGWALVAIGAVSTIPVVMSFLGKPELEKRALGSGPLTQERKLALHYHLSRLADPIQS